MKNYGKKHKQAAALIEAGRIYTVDEAVELLERTNTVKFDPTVEVHFNLAIDPKYADQMVRSTVTLPNGTGKAPKIGAFTDLGNEKELLALGANVAGGEDLLDQVLQGKIDFTVAVATPGMMKKMGKAAKVLGPKGLMPNPKSGTVTMDVAKAVADIKAGKVEYRVDKTSIVHCPIGKASFGSDKLEENLTTLMDAIVKAKPSAAKGTYLKSVVISSTMGPGVKFNTLKF